MGDPVNPETGLRLDQAQPRARIVDENTSGKRRRHTSQTSAEGAVAPTPGERSNPVPRMVGPLDPDMPRPGDAAATGRSESSAPRTRPVSPASERMDAPITASIKRPKRRQAGPSRAGLGVAAGLAVALGVVVVAVWPRAPVSSSIAFADPVPGMLARWGGDAEQPALAAYVGRIAVSVATPLGLGDLKVLVARESSVHAVALPGRQILVSVGMLRRLASEAQLAALLAHLCAHIAAGDVERAYRLERAADPITNASTVAARTHTNDEEQRALGLTLTALQTAGYSSAALTDVFDLLGVKSGRTAPFVVQHPLATQALRDLRANATAGRGGEADYARHVLDALGRTETSAAGARSANPPLPPKAPLTPPIDMSKPPGGVKSSKKPLSAPERRVTSEPPAPPL